MQLLLIELKQLLKKHALWQREAPSEAALSSQQPFAIDTLEPHEWLQWIFIHRIESMLAAGQSAPSEFEIAPYFEQVWKGQSQYQDILTVLKKIDGAAK